MFRKLLPINSRFWFRRQLASPIAPVVFLCALFLVVGVQVLDDYGVSWDETFHRSVALTNAHYIVGESELAGWPFFYYGPAFTLTQLLAEVALGLEDSRHIYLSRHLMLHLLFLTAGFFCALLTYRLFNNRLLAVFALLLFLLHPRLYAHSFFNNADLSFLSAFMIALYLSQRAFRRDTMAAFVLCAIGIGVMSSLRQPGLMLFFAVLAMRACDLCQAATSGERKHILATSGVFILVSILTLYASWPYLWSSPLEHARDVFAGADQAIAVTRDKELFQGELFRAQRWYYTFVWIGISTPPLVLLLSLAGMFSLGLGGISHPHRILSNTDLRFGFLLIACLLLPPLVLAMLKFPLYDGWRHVYFLYAPLCLLGVFGLHWLTSASRNPYWQGIIYGVTGIALGAVMVSMLSLHPHQQVYFNFLVDRKTPQYLHGQYAIGAWGPPYRAALEWLLAAYPRESLCVQGLNDLHSPNLNRNGNILPKAERERLRIAATDGCATDFFINNHNELEAEERSRTLESLAPRLYALRAWNNTFLSVSGINLSMLDESLAAPYLDTWREAVAGEAIARSHYDIYRDENQLIYVRETCTLDDMENPFFLHTIAANLDDLPEQHRGEGFERLNFTFYRHGVRIDDTCMAIVPLPPYDVARVNTGQRLLQEGGWGLAPEGSEVARVNTSQQLLPEGAVVDTPIWATEFSL